MGQLILFLVYLALIVAIVGNIILLLRSPAARTPLRLLFVVGGSALMAGVIYFGVFN